MKWLIHYVYGGMEYMQTESLKEVAERVGANEREVLSIIKLPDDTIYLLIPKRQEPIHQ